LLKNVALWYREFGAPASVLQLEAHELTRPADGVIRVRMHAAPINPSDLIPITGAYRHRVTPPRIAGYEGLGTVIDGSYDANLSIGQRVLPLRGPGTWQSYIDLHPDWVVPVPDFVDDAAAIQGYINPLTALCMLRKWPVRNKHVLLTASGSSCGNLLAQWAFAAGAHSVTGIYRSTNHISKLLHIGVTPIHIEAFEQITDAASKADVVFDAVGGKLASTILAYITPESSFVSYGLLSGQAIPISPTGPAPQRFHLRDHIAAATPSEWQQWFKELWPRLAQSSLPDITPYHLTDWKDALKLFYSSGRFSKPVLKL